MFFPLHQGGAHTFLGDQIHRPDLQPEGLLLLLREHGRAPEADEEDK